MSYNDNLQPQANKPKFSVAITTDVYKKLINNTLVDPERAKRFVASITSAVAVNPDLQDCDAGSILAGAFLGESLNLSPSPQLGQYYLVPFKDKKAGITKAQFILGYKGYIQLALRSGYYADLDVTEIKEGEYLGKDPNTGKPRFCFIEDDDERDIKPVIGYMAYFEYLNGFRKTIYWSKKKVLKHADTYSQAFSAKAYDELLEGKIPNNELWKYSSFWYKDFDDMAKKTLLKHLISRWGIMSTEMQRAITDDDAVTGIGKNNEIVTDVPVAESQENEVDAEEVREDGQQIHADDGADGAEYLDLDDL